MSVFGRELYSINLIVNFILAACVDAALSKMGDILLSVDAVSDDDLDAEAEEYDYWNGLRDEIIREMEKM